MPGVRLIGNVTIGVALLYGGLRALEGDLTIGVLTAFLLYLRMFFEPMQEISQFFNTFQSASSALEKLSGVLEEQPSVVQPEPRAAAGGPGCCHVPRRRAAKLPVYQPDSYKKPEVWEEFKALKPDLQVMAFVTLFVPEEFLNIPTHGSIQYHPSLLPLYRGASAINWPIIKGEKETGLSIFWPDNGLDTGDVLIQKKTPISDNDTLGTVYFDRLFPMGVEAMLESVDLVKAGKAPRIKQDHAKATYEGRCGPDNARIDFGKPWEQIHRLIRGCNPAPGAWATINGAEAADLRRHAAARARSQGHRREDRRGRRGRWRSFTVVCADGRIKVMRVQRRRAESRRRRMGRVRQDRKGRAVFVISSSSLRVIPERAAARARNRIASHVRTHGRPTSNANRTTPCPPRSIRIRNPTSKSPRPPRCGRSSTSPRRSSASTPKNLEPYGHYKAKVSMDYIKSLQSKKNGKLILVTAISPTPAGEGKTTTTVGLTDALNHIGKKAMCALREPSLGPSLRHEGRRRRRRLCAGGPDGRHQPAFHRRFPRHHLGAQSALGADRQSHLLGQCARHRLAAASPGGA